MAGRYLRFAPARATRSATRANLRCLGLSAGIAIALAGCDHTPADRTRHDLEAAFNNCIWTTVGSFQAASVEVIRACREIARERVAPASGMPLRENNEDCSRPKAGSPAVSKANRDAQ